MKRKLFFAALVVGLILAGSMALAQQGYKQGQANAGRAWSCPWGTQGQGTLQQGQGFDRQGKAPGRYQGRPGRGPGQHMRGSHFNRGQSGAYAAQQQTDALSQEQARQLANNYVAQNPNLQIGDISEQDRGYVVTVLTQDGSLVDRLYINKNSGRMHRNY